MDPSDDQGRLERGTEGGGPTGRGARRGGAARGRVRPRGERASDPGGVARVFGRGEDPLAWSISIFRSGTLQVRAHLVVLMMAVAELALASAHDRIGPMHVLLAIGALLGLVLVRELGRWLIVRSMERDPAPLVLWPLGSLSPTPWLGSRRRELVVATGGLTVNMLLWPVFALGLYSSGLGWDAFVFNPFRPSTVLVEIGSIWTATLWWLYYMNALLVGVHALLPMLPMDAGRVLEVALRARLSAPRSASLAALAARASVRSGGNGGVSGRATWLAARVGAVTAIALFVAGMSSGQARVMGLAVFGAVVCWLQARRVQFALDPASPDSVPGDEPVSDFSMLGLEALADDIGDEFAGNMERGPARSGPVCGEIPESEGESRVVGASMEAVLDTVLAKISLSGLSSLTEDERGILEAATRERGGKQGPSGRPPELPLR